LSNFFKFKINNTTTLDVILTDSMVFWSF